MPKGDGAVRRAAAREQREEEIEERKFKKAEEKKLIFGINPLHLFFLLLFTLPTILGVVDYFFPFSKVPGGGARAVGAAPGAGDEWVYLETSDRSRQKNCIRASRLTGGGISGVMLACLRRARS